MKKSLIILTAALSFGFAAAQTAPAAQVPTLTDVPAGHWAKDAIDKIVARGIILGYPDGTFRGTQNLTRYEAAVIIARLLDQIAQGSVKTETGTTVNITGEELTALQNAVQELAADLAALGVRVTDLEANSVSQDDFARLEAQVNGLASAAGDPAALDALTQQIADLNARTDDLQANYDGLRADVDDNASSIAALNDLTVLLNNDILGLQDRVSAVETAQADFVTRAEFNTLGTKVTGIDTRVVKLEAAPVVSFTGSIAPAYGSIGIISGNQGSNFDIRRLTNKTFAADAFDDDVTTTDTAKTFYDLGLTFGLKVANFTAANGTVTINNAAANFSVGSSNLLRLEDATVSGKFSGADFSVVYDTDNSVFTFNDYLFKNITDDYSVRRGAVATFSAPALPFAPKLIVVAGSATGTSLIGNYYGVRAEVNPFNLGTIGLNYAQNIGNRSAVGLDANFTVGPIKLKGVYDVSALDNVPVTIPPTPYAGIGDAFSRANKAGYVQASADFGIAKVAANYRAIDPAYFKGVAGLSDGTNTDADAEIPYGTNVVGYGGALATTLGPVTIAAFGDRASEYSTGSPTFNASYRTAFGVAAGAKLFGLSLTGFYNSATKTNNNTYAHIIGNYANAATNTSSSLGNYFYYNSTAAYQGTALVPYAFSSTYGGVLSHDGSAADALIKGLNFTLADGYFYQDQINDFQAYGSYAANLFGLTVTPFARYHNFSVPNNNGTALTTTTDGTATRSYNAVKYGVQVSSTPLAIIGKPSVGLAFANAITNPGNTIAVNNGTKTELFGQATLTLNDIGVVGLTPSIGYAYYQGFNVASAQVGSSASSSTATFSPTADRFYVSPLSGAADPYTGGNVGAAAGSTQGVFAQLSYAGIGLNYGMFYYTDFKNAANNSVAQAFKVSYELKF